MLTTWRDGVLHCLRSAGLDVSDSLSLTRAKEAVQVASGLVQSARNWTNAWALTRLVTTAIYSTGTIAYTASTRTVTLTGGTWPSWAEYGTIVISDVPYSVQQRASDTSLILKADREPGANVASGTAYALFRDEFPMPADFGSILEHYRRNDWQLEYVHPEVFLSLSRSSEIYNQARVFTVMEDSRRQDRRSVYFYPAPNQQDLLEIRYKRRPVSLRTFDVTTGTVSVTLGGATVTGVGTAWTSALVGAVIRFGTASTLPEDAYATDAYQHEATILSVESATSLTLTSGATAASSAVKYRISDALPSGTVAMRSALLACCLWQFEDRRGSTERIGKAYQNYRTLLDAAAREDQPNIGTSFYERQSRLDAAVPASLAAREI